MKLPTARCLATLLALASATGPRAAFATSAAPAGGTASGGGQVLRLARTWAVIDGDREECVVAAYQVIGPGTVIRHFAGKPDVGVERFNHVDSVWEWAEPEEPPFEYVSGSQHGWDSDGAHHTVGRYRAGPRTYRGLMKLCPPGRCNLAGRCNQVAQSAVLTLSFYPEGSRVPDDGEVATVSARGESNPANTSTVAAARTPDLSGIWSCDDGGTYVIRQSGEVVRWQAQSADDGATWNHEFEGTLSGTLIKGRFQDSPTGRVRGQGDLVVRVVSASELELVSSSTPFGGKRWTRRGAAPLAGIGIGSGTEAQPPPPPPIGARVVNLALGKPATQSSIYGGTGADQGPQFGVDGILDSQPRDPFMMVHTGADNPAWWQVDLEAVHTLTHLKLYNRQACCQEKARTVQVLLSLDGSHWKRAYGHDGSTFKVLDVDLGGQQARFVRIQLAEPGFLHFQECEVYGN